MLREFSEKQREIARWAMHGSEDGIIADGSVRSGKTIAMASNFLVWSQVNFTGQDFIIAGQTAGATVRNVIAPMKRILHEDFETGYRHNRSDGTLTVGTNVYHIFGGHDERSQDLVQGMTAAGMLLDECALMPRSFIEQCMARCSVEGARYWFNCNPADPRNYVKAELIDKAKDKHFKYLHFDMADNLTLSDEYRRRVARQYAGVFYRRYILGEWCRAEGLVYADFADGEIVGECEATRKDRCFLSIDYGIQNPTAALLWKIQGGRAYLCDEWYHDGRESGNLTDTELVDGISGMVAGRYLDTVVVDPSASSLIEEMKRRTDWDITKADNRVVEGISNCMTAMKSGQLIISPRCKSTIDELGLYSWDTKGRDAVLKEHDHAMDAMRYFIRTIARRELPCFAAL